MPSRSTPASVPLGHAKPGLAIILMSDPVLLMQGLDPPARAGLHLDPGPEMSKRGTEVDWLSFLEVPDSGVVFAC